MNTRRAAGIGLAAAIAVTVAATAPAAQADPAGRQQSKAGGAQPRDDFNGDGYADVAFPAPDATVDGKAKAGYVAVVYGSANGLDTSAKQVFDQNAPGMPGAAEAGDAYGSSVTTGDLDGDGYADLVVGSEGENPDETGNPSGSLAVIWGGPEGLGNEAATLPAGAADTYGVGGQTLAGDFDGDGAIDVATVVDHSYLRVLSGPFGRDGAPRDTRDTAHSIHTILDMAAGDVNGDGVTDLVAAENDEDEYDARHVYVYDGSPDGLKPFSTLKGGDGEYLQGGEHVGVGDVNADGVDDIVTGRAVDGYDSDLDQPLAKGGMLTYIPGSDSGPAGAEAQVLNQDSAGIPGSAETQDRFGTSISVADINGDGYADVSTGLPGEDLGSTGDAGAAITLFGKPDGLSGEHAATITQNTAGVPGVAEAKDAFGSATTLADVDGDGHADLVVGAPGENGEAGSVWAFRSTAQGVTPTGSFTFGAGTLGTVAGKAHLGAGFAY